jgi:hypothetical protein
MQDGAPCHWAWQMKDFLTSNNIELLDWSGNSPDLNPIENLWSVMKDKVAAMQPSNLKSLEKCTKQVWCKEFSEKSTVRNLSAECHDKSRLLLTIKGDTLGTEYIIN